MKVSSDVMRQLEALYKEYEREVESSPLTLSAKNTYVLHVRQFLKWVKGDFIPGSRKS